MTAPARWRRALWAQSIAALLLVAGVGWRLGTAASVAVAQGAGLVAFNLALGQRLAPAFSAASGSGPGGPTAFRPGRLAALFAGKLLLQLGVAAAVLLGRPPAPGPFVVGLATVLVPLASVGLPRLGRRWDGAAAAGGAVGPGEGKHTRSC